MRKVIFLCMGILMLISLLLVVSCGQTPDATQSSTSGTTQTAPPVETTTEAATQTTTETTKEEEPVVKEQYTASTPDDIKAMWLSQYDMSVIYSSNSKQRAEKDYKIMMERMLDRVVKTGINTIFVQVRPNMDSMYPSKYYPMSRYVVGKYGKEASYDPFEILIESAHERGLSVHAWINPMRGLLLEEMAAIDETYPAKQLYVNTETRGKALVAHDGRWYLNPAYKEARDLIVNGAREILTNYEVDGLHMDDYFYPSGCTDAFDEKAYLEYIKNNKRVSLMAFRRENVNTLVRELYAMVKETNDTVLFGISPAGNMDNNYNKLGADVATWCSNEGYIDYICPQVYWGMEHKTHDFVKISNQFNDMIKVDSIKLVIGMTLGKAKSGVDEYAGDGKFEWRDHKDVLYRCLNHTQTLEHCVGVSYFSYQYFYSPESGTAVSATKAERELFVPRLKEISWKTTNS